MLSPRSLRSPPPSRRTLQKDQDALDKIMKSPKRPGLLQKLAKKNDALLTDVRGNNVDDIITDYKDATFYYDK